MTHWRSALTVCAVVPLLMTLSGCNQQPSPRSLATFQADLQPGLLSHDLVLTSQTTLLLRNVDAKVTVYWEQDVRTFERHWATWQRGEAKAVSIPTGGSLQRITLSGTAELGAQREPVQLSAEWHFTSH